MHIQNLNAVTDPEQRFALSVCLVQENFVDVVTLAIGVGGFCAAGLVVLDGIDIGAAAGQENGGTGVGQSLDFGSAHVQRNLHRVPARQVDRALVLRKGS